MRIARPIGLSEERAHRRLEEAVDGYTSRLKGQPDLGHVAHFHWRVVNRVLYHSSRDHRLDQASQSQTEPRFPKDRARRREPPRGNGEVRHLVITPVYDASIGRTRIGFTYGSHRVGYAPPQAAGQAASAMWRVTKGTAGVFSRIFESQQRKKIHGIVGISDVAHQQFELGAPEALTLIALISLSLAIVNLAPFLPLDGGHIFWSLVEKVRGRPVPFKVMESASAIGFVLVLMLFAIGFTNDLNTLQNGGFNTR